MQIDLCKIERRGLASSQAVTCDLFIVDLTGFAASQVEDVGWTALGKKELCVAQYAQDQSPCNILTLAGGLQVTFEQGLVQFFCSGTYG